MRFLLAHALYLDRSLVVLTCRRQDQITFNSKKWETELAKARDLDVTDLELAAFEVASNPHHLLLAQSLSQTEIDELCSLFEVRVPYIVSSRTSFSLSTSRQLPRELLMNIVFILSAVLTASKVRS